MLQQFNKNRVWLRPEIEIEFGSSKPLYPNKESGVVLVVGTAPCWEEDVHNALQMYPDAELCAVNEAVRLVPAKHFASCHAEKLDMFMSKAVEKWGLYPEFMHVGDKYEIDCKPVYQWSFRAGAGSATFAAFVMVSIGYDLVILCGCPMNGGGGYAPEVAVDTHKSTPDDPRLGELTPQHGMVMAWNDALRQIKTKYPEVSDKIRSMSGTTKDIFGGI